MRNLEPASLVGESSGANRGVHPDRLLGLVLLIALWCSSATVIESDAQAVNCEAPESCLELVSGVIDARGGISEREAALAKKLQTFGAEAVPDLLMLLSAPDEATRDFAGYTLRDIDGLKPKDVAPILRAAQEEYDGGWLPPALARIGTPEAIAGLVSLVRKYPSHSAGSQISYAFERLGPKGVPGLVEVIGNSDSQDVRMAAGGILTRLGPDAESAASPLAKIAADSERSAAVRLDMVRILDSIGPAAAPAHDVLMGLLRSEKGDFQWAVASALAAIGGSGLREVYDVVLAPPKVPFDGLVTNRLEQLESGEYWEQLGRVAMLGERGGDAVPAVLKLLHDPHPNIRVNAARALGFIGDASVGPHLVALVSDDDWLMVKTVVESLGRIRYVSGRREIALVARGHWYPPVREIAKQAEAALDGAYRYEAASGDRAFYFSFDPKRFPFATPTSCATTARYPSEVIREEHFSSVLSPERAKQFSYKHEVDNYESETDPPGKVLIDQVPDFGLRGPDGWFLGASRGEFGGELVWRADRGTDQLIVDDEIENVYELSPGKFVVMAGLAHLGLDSGHVYRLERSNGRWRTRWWLRLPGEPAKSWMTDKGLLVINTTSGSVLLDRKGSLRMADCTANG